HQAMADSHIAVGQSDEALDQLQKGQAVAGNFKVDPASRYPFSTPLARGDLVRRMAEAYAATGNMAGAEQALKEAKQHLPYDRAIETLEYGMQIGPNNIALGSRLAKLLLRRGYLDKGVDGLIRVAEQQRKAGQIKDAVASLQQAAEVHWTLGQQDKARVLYDRI